VVGLGQLDAEHRGHAAGAGTAVSERGTGPGRLTRPVGGASANDRVSHLGESGSGRRIAMWPTR
jgi:hypothetical protein